MCASHSNGAERTAKVCVDAYPPYQMQQPDGTWVGENIVIIDALFARLNITPEYTASIPFKRCLAMLEKGEVDVMPGLVHTKERARFAHLLRYDDGQLAAFYVKPPTALANFTDLKDKWVAHLRGTRYFEEFDRAPPQLVKKIEVNSIEAGLNMLVLGRVDSMLCSVDACEQALIDNPQFSSIVESDYKIMAGTDSHLGISKSSSLGNEIVELSEVSNTLLESGTYQRLLQNSRREYASQHRN